MMGARRGVERGNKEENVMTYGLMNDGMFGREKIPFCVWLIMNELVIKYSAYFLHITHHRNAKRPDLVDERV